MSKKRLPTDGGGQLFKMSKTDRRRELAYHGETGDLEFQWDQPPSLEELDRHVLKRMETEDAKNANKLLVPETPPMHMWPDDVKDEYMNNIGAIAQMIEKRIVRPNDARVHQQLRQNEALLASERGVFSVSIYNPVTPDKDYARNLLQMADRPKMMRGNASTHTHPKEESVILELREALDLPLGEPVPDVVLQDEQMPVSSVPRNSVVAVRGLDTFAGLVATDKILRRQRSPLTVRGVLQLVDRHCTTPLFCVRFLRDRHVEFVYFMETTANFFAVFTLQLPELYDAETLIKLRHTVYEEVRKERNAAIERMQKLGNDETELKGAERSTTLNVEKEKWLRDEREFHSLSDEYQRRYETEPDGNEWQREIKQFCPHAVFAPDKSRTLMELQCYYLYHYFTTCQCAFDAEKELKPKVTDKNQLLVERSRVTSSVPFNFQTKK